VQNYVLHVPETISNIESTISEESSYYLCKDYEVHFPANVKYDNSKYTLESIISLINTFAVFHAKVKVFDESKQFILSKVPIEVFKYKELEDGSYYYIKSLPHKHKDGPIVQGALWSNGMFYIKTYEDKIIEAVLYIDQYTKDLYKYP